tara:strand:+ start:237 stop:422 length:186 start_codon:yes stop_codon:yes gene_type:complete
MVNLDLQTDQFISWFDPVIEECGLEEAVLSLVICDAESKGKKLNIEWNIDCIMADESDLEV